MVVLRLMRAGAKKRPFYRIVAADSRRQRDGRFLEILGHYNPIPKPHELVLKQEKIEKWLEQGAQPSVQVASLIRSAGIPLRLGMPKLEGAVEAQAERKAAKKAAKKSAKKSAVKRAAPRKPSERKTRAKATRKKNKGVVKKKAAKKA
jgi:small subunit ribosomal protein S16